MSLDYTTMDLNVRRHMSVFVGYYGCHTSDVRLPYSKHTHTYPSLLYPLTLSTCTIMQGPSTPETPTIIPSISMESITDTCKRLKRRIQPEEDNPRITLDLVYSSICEMHEQEKVPNTASKEEFMQKVKSYPQEKFISELKDIVNTGKESNWIPIVVNGMYSISFYLWCSNHFPHRYVY